MIVCDASVVISWLARNERHIVEGLDRLLLDGKVALAPVTLTEVLSGPRVEPYVAELLGGFELLDLRPGYWVRAGRLRQTLGRAGRKAALGDVLTAQVCLDYEAPLLARDKDYRAFAELAGLKLA